MSTTATMRDQAKLQDEIIKRNRQRRRNSSEWYRRALQALMDGKYERARALFERSVTELEHMH